MHFSARLVHLSDQSIDLILTIAIITALDVVLEFACSEATVGVRQLERPQEVIGLLEVGSDGHDLVNEVLHANDAELAEMILDELVIGERDSLLVNLAIATLVDQFANGLQIGIAVGDVRVDDGEHFLGGFSETDEDAVVELQESKQLHDLSRLGSDLVDTLQMSEHGKEEYL